MEALQIVLSTVGAIGGAYLGVQWRARSVEERELRQLLDEAAPVLTRANQKRGGAYIQFLQEGVSTSPRGFELLQSLRTELSEAEQIRDRLALRTDPDSAVFKHYSGALEALGKVSIALGVAAMMPAEALDQGLKQADKMDAGEKEFERARTAFLAAAQRRVRASRQPLRRLFGGVNRPLNDSEAG